MARLSSMPFVIARFFEWSVIAMYLYPRFAAASAISRIVCVPSLSVVCMWMSPRRSVSAISTGSSCFSAISISPLFSRSSGGIQSIPSAL